MDRRLELHALLESLLDGGNAYFQPPQNIQMTYPAIVYNKDDELTRYADNLPYLKRIGYMVTVVTTDPDSPLPSKVSQLPLCSFSRHYTADQLHHDTYILYY